MENQYFQQSVYSVKEYQCLRVYGLDITKRKQAEADRKEREEELYRLNRTLRAISNCNQSMMRAENEYALMEEVCKIVVED